MEYTTIIHFWFQEVTPQQWWQKDTNLDQQIKQRFSSVHQQAISGELFTWRQFPKGRLAEIIILDQFSRHLFREDSRAYAYDSIALVLAQEAITQGIDKNFTPLEKTALYLPFMHSESKKIHEQAILLFSAKGLEENLVFEHKHQEIIDQFGRYPHRNKALSRQSTPAEIEFLKQPGSSF